MLQPSHALPTLSATQMEALRAGLDGTPLVLIQGPPGTGKTRTILNLLSVVMHSAAKGSLELVAKAASTAACSGQGPGPGGGAAAAAGGTDESEDQGAAAERAQLWRLQSPWMFGEPTLRDMHGPTIDTGESGWRQLRAVMKQGLLWAVVAGITVSQHSCTSLPAWVLHHS